MTSPDMTERFFSAQRHAVDVSDPAWSAALVAEHVALLDRADRLGPPGRRLVMRLMCSRSKVPMGVAVSVAEAVLSPAETRVEQPSVD